MGNTRGLCVADRHFQPDAYMPDHEIQYDDLLNHHIEELVKANPIHYWNAFSGSTHGKYGDYSIIRDYVMECTKHLPENQFKISIRLFWVLQKWQDFPICGNPDCNTRLIIDNQNRSFRLAFGKDGKLVYNWPVYCCHAHAQSDPILRAKCADTCMSRYGFVNAFQVPEFKEKAITKRILTIGVAVPAKSPTILKKMQETCIKKYGAPNPFQSVEIMDRAHAEYEEKTGYCSPQKDPNVWAKSKARQLAERGYTHAQMRNKAPGYKKNILNSEYDEPLFSLEEFVMTDNGVIPLKFRCKKCGNEFSSIHVRTHNRCPMCYPEDQIIGQPLFLSKLNRRMFRILDEMGIKYEQEFTLKFEGGEKRRLRRYDIRIGNIIIELNGDYWHARPGFVYRGRPINADTVMQFYAGRQRAAKEIWQYDLEKTELAKSKGYSVIVLWESEMNGMSDNDLRNWVSENISNSNH